MGTVEITNAANNSVTVRAVSANPVRRAFADGAAGAWFDPSDLDTMFQDSAGTTAVTGAGDPVGLIKDKSGNGNDATQDTDATRPVLQQDGSGNWYLDFDGVDDELDFPQPLDGTSASSLVASLTPRDFSGADILLSIAFNTTAGEAREFNTQGQVFVRDGIKTWDIGAEGTTEVQSYVSPANTNVTDAEFWRDGAKPSLTSEDAQAIDTLTQTNSHIASRGGARFCDLDLYQMVVLDTALSDVERSEIESFAADKAGVTL